MMRFPFKHCGQVLKRNHGFAMSALHCCVGFQGLTFYWEQINQITIAYLLLIQIIFGVYLHQETAVIKV